MQGHLATPPFSLSPSNHPFSLFFFNYKNRHRPFIGPTAFYNINVFVKIVLNDNDINFFKVKIIINYYYFKLKIKIMIINYDFKY